MTKCKPLPSLEQVQDLLAYDESSPSGLRWKATRAPQARAGSIAGNIHALGYWRVKLFGRDTPAHRLVWLLIHGEDPWPLQVDHRDRDRTNNAVANLRLAAPGQNSANRASKPGSSSRWLGVSLRPTEGLWRAQIKTQGRKAHLGQFRCETAAALAYDRAAIEHHGEFARPNILVPRPEPASTEEGEA